MGMRVFTLPDLGEGLSEADLVSWLVAPGDRVVADQPLAVVETDKAAVEVPAPWPGVVARLLAEPGETIAVGAPLVEFSDAPRADAGAIVGDAAVPQPAEAPEPAPPPPPAGERPHAAPAARALARELGVALEAVRGSGPGGAITRADVARAADGPAAAPTLSAARRAMARAMTRAHAEVVPATLTDVADVSRWLSPKADVLARLVRAVCRGADAEPALNGRFDPAKPARIPASAVDLGIAVDAPDGLYVPVLRDAQTLGLPGIRGALAPLLDAARTRRLDRAAQEGATFTLSSFGPLGGRHAALVVHPPQIAILGAGRAYETAGWRDGAAVRRLELPLSLTFDHRAATGGETARFLAAVVADLEAPA